jgi:hypothetical protein
MDILQSLSRSPMRCLYRRKLIQRFQGTPPKVELVNAPSEVKARKRLSLRGHKIKATSERAFRVDHVSRDYGACSL